MKQALGIGIGANFSLRAQKSIDDRQYFDTLQDMLSFPEASLPDFIDTIILSGPEQGKIYRFNRFNIADPVLGKWRDISDTVASDGAIIVENYTELLTVAPSVETLAYVKNDEVINDSSGDKTYNKGFYLWDTVNSKWEPTSSGVSDTVDINNNSTEQVEITEGVPENISCIKTVQKVGDEITTIIVANEDSSDPDKIKSGDVINITKEILGITIFEYNILSSEDEVIDPFA